METRTPAVYHASDSVLKRIDALQHRLLRELGVSAGTAIHDWNLAPLETEWDIAMLGVIHSAVLGEGPPRLRRFFRLAAPAACQRGSSGVSAEATESGGRLSPRGPPCREPGRAATSTPGRS